MFYSTGLVSQSDNANKWAIFYGPGELNLGWTEAWFWASFSPSLKPMQALYNPLRTEDEGKKKLEESQVYIRSTVLLNDEGVMSVF